VLFDRSWCDRAGVETVMGFCTPAEHRRFLHQCPVFERLLVEDGILLRKYWFSVSDEEQQRRVLGRLEDPMRPLTHGDRGILDRGPGAVVTGSWVTRSRTKVLSTVLPEAAC